jgi:hypothetical protein
MLRWIPTFHRTLLPSSSRWNVAVGHKRFGGPCCRHLQGEVLRYDTNVSEDPAAVIFKVKYCGLILTFRRTLLPSSSGWNVAAGYQRFAPKRWYSTTLHGVTTYKKSIWIFTAVKTWYIAAWPWSWRISQADIRHVTSRDVTFVRAERNALRCWTAQHFRQWVTADFISRWCLCGGKKVYVPFF